MPLLVNTTVYICTYLQLHTGGGNTKLFITAPNHNQNKELDKDKDGLKSYCTVHINLTNIAPIEHCTKHQNIIFRHPVTLIKKTGYLRQGHR